MKPALLCCGHDHMYSLAPSKNVFDKTVTERDAAQNATCLLHRSALGQGAANAHRVMVRQAS
eukprot:4410167-Amphidinium_carterae.1